VKKSATPPEHIFSIFFNQNDFLSKGFQHQYDKLIPYISFIFNPKG
jgi:hypothetical protein